jgi:hypothetical protein
MMHGRMHRMICHMMKKTCIGYACRVHDDDDDDDDDDHDNVDEDVGVDGGYACQDRLLW